MKKPSEEKRTASRTAGILSAGITPRITHNPCSRSCRSISSVSSLGRIARGSAAQEGKGEPDEPPRAKVGAGLVGKGLPPLLEGDRASTRRRMRQLAAVSIGALRVPGAAPCSGRTAGPQLLRSSRLGFQVHFEFSGVQASRRPQEGSEAATQAAGNGRGAAVLVRYLRCARSLLAAAASNPALPPSDPCLNDCLGVGGWGLSACSLWHRVLRVSGGAQRRADRAAPARRRALLPPLLRAPRPQHHPAPILPRGAPLVRSEAQARAGGAGAGGRARRGRQAGTGEGGRRLLEPDPARPTRGPRHLPSARMLRILHAGAGCRTTHDYPRSSSSSSPASTTERSHPPHATPRSVSTT